MPFNNNTIINDIAHHHDENGSMTPFSHLTQSSTVSLMKSLAPQCFREEELSNMNFDS